MRGPRVLTGKRITARVAPWHTLVVPQAHARSALRRDLRPRPADAWRSPRSMQFGICEPACAAPKSCRRRTGRTAPRFEPSPPWPTAAGTTPRRWCRHQPARRVTGCVDFHGTASTPLRRSPSASVTAAQTGISQRGCGSTRLSRGVGRTARSRRLALTATRPRPAQPRPDRCRTRGSAEDADVPDADRRDGGS
jgi:hypothetical protein